jgi:hypothetical protein
MKRIIIRRTLVVALAGMSVLGAVSSLQAGENEGCSNASLSGPYVFWNEGTIVPNGTPVRSITVTTFDGKGHYFTTGTINSDGTVTEIEPVEGTYVVDKNCTGFRATATEAFKFILIDGGKEIVQLRLDSRVLSGIGKRQFARQHDDDRN